MQASEKMDGHLLREIKETFDILSCFLFFCFPNIIKIQKMEEYRIVAKILILLVGMVGGPYLIL